MASPSQSQIGSEGIHEFMNNVTHHNGEQVPSQAYDNDAPRSPSQSVCPEPQPQLMRSIEQPDLIATSPARALSPGEPSFEYHDNMDLSIDPPFANMQPFSSRARELQDKGESEQIAHDSCRSSYANTSPRVHDQQAVQSQDDDGDDDFIIIDRSEAPTSTQRRWKEHEPMSRSQSQSIKVNEEHPQPVPMPQIQPTTPPPPPSTPPTTTQPSRLQAILAQQRARLEAGTSSPGNSSFRPSVNHDARQGDFERGNDDAYNSGRNISTPVRATKDTSFSSINKGKKVNHPNIAQDRGGSIGKDTTRGNVYSPSSRGGSYFEYGRYGDDDNEMDADGPVSPEEEDFSWMHQDEAEEDDVLEDLKAMIARLEAKEKGSGGLSSSQSMDLFKLKQQYEVRENMQNRKGVEHLVVPASSLFVGAGPSTGIPHRRRRDHLDHSSGDITGPPTGVPDSHTNFDNNDDISFSRMLDQELGDEGVDPNVEEANPAAPYGLTKRGTPRKRPVKTAVEKDEERRAKERAKANKKRNRPGIPTAKPIKPAKSKKEPKKSKTVIPHPSNFGNSSHDAIGQMLLDNLAINDPIQDRLQNPIFDRAPEPVISGRMTKATQFQQLFANIPDTDAAGRKVIRTDKKNLREASKGFGWGAVTAQDGRWLIRGMNFPLYHHQLLGAQWMIQRERSTLEPRGGLLADSMGLGKTIQMLACMIGNLPTDMDQATGCKATLVVVPSSVLTQWIDEVKHHTKPGIFPKVIHYKASAGYPLSVLRDTDIVVATYQEAMKQFAYPDAEGREFFRTMGPDAWRKTALHSLGDLFQISWYRIVLDEAQAIKNHLSQTSMACQTLNGRYRWCLSGTPLLNKLEELFPYLLFLRAHMNMDRKKFQQFFCDASAEDCYSRISTILSYTMMRRTMKTSILNRPIIVLPKPHPEVVYVNFSPEEQIIYRITENRFRSNLNSYFTKGEARRNYSLFMVQLLRLRQCTGHPFMLERTIKESWTLEDINQYNAKTALLGITKKPFYEQCRTWVSQRDEALQTDNGLPADEARALPFGAGTYGYSFDFNKAVSGVDEADLYSRVVCSICGDLPMAPTSTDCGHIFCEECLNSYIQTRVDEGHEIMTCPSCDRVFHNAKRVTPSEAATHPDDAPVKKKGKGKKGGKKQEKSTGYSKGRDVLGFEPKTADGTWVDKSDYDPDFPLTPSTKTTALKSILLKGFAEAPLDKVVIYVQFRTLARIVGRICESENWKFLYLTGDSSLEHRSNVIKKFKDEPDVMILIAGLKCGGLGLNFPWANRCISLDLWWNHAVEQQAFGRIFRIGQQKETWMTRLVVKNSVDMRMMTMQLHKLQNLERAMREGEWKRDRPQLNLTQLANLFGFLKTDKDDKIIRIEADYDDEAGGGDPGASTRLVIPPDFGTSAQAMEEAMDDAMDEEM